MEQKKTVLCILSHPDDVEFQCAGTLALLSNKGWNVVIATMTPGQAGSVTLDADSISKVRRKEAEKSALLIQGTYHCLECEDIFILYDRMTILKCIELIRKVRPDMVITASPSDYIVDHEITSKLVQTASLAAGIPNIEIEGTTPTEKVPHLYYCDPTHGKDKFGKMVESSIFVDISSTIETKCDMLACHESQRKWLEKISEVDELIESMKAYSSEVGNKIGVEFAEGFRQHLGFSYPTENILQRELEGKVYLNDQT